LVAAAKASKVIHTSAFALSRNPSRTTIEEIFRKYSGQEKILTLDPNYHPGFWPDLPDFLTYLKDFFSLVSVVKPSLDDSRRIFGSGLEPAQYLDRFLELGPAMVALTMGDHGSLFGTADGERVHIIPNPVEVVDVTGAGDAYWTGFLGGLYEGHSPLLAARLGQAVAEYKVGFLGPVNEFPPIEEFLEIASKYQTNRS
jgi:fructokinase